MLSVSGKRLVTVSQPGALRPGAQDGWLQPPDFLFPTGALPDSATAGQGRGSALLPLWVRAGCPLASPHSALLSLPGDMVRPRPVLAAAP